MPVPIRRRLINFQKRIALTIAPLMALTAMAPVTISCHAGAVDSETGIEELRELVRAASGRPAVNDLTKIESRYARTRTAALARFLRGYLYCSAQNYQPAVEALDAKVISGATALGDYALFYRAESEAASDAKSDARHDYSAVSARYSDSLKAREAKLRAASMAVALGDPKSAI